MAMRTQPTLSPGMLARISEAAALSPSSFRKRYRSSYETPSPSSSLNLPVQKRYRGTFELILDTDSEGDKLGEEDTEEDNYDEGQGLDNEGQQHAVLVVDTVASEPFVLGYGAARSHALESTKEITPSTYEVWQSSRSVPEQEGANMVSAFIQSTIVTWVHPKDGRVYTDILTYVPLAAPVQTPPSPEWSLGSLPVSPSSPVVPSPLASPAATPTPTISVDEDYYDKDLRELYTRSGAVRDEIFSQRYRFRSLEREQGRATVTFSAIWRPILALKTWAGQTDAQREALWHAIYDIQRENHDLRRQLVEERHGRLELADRVARMERRQKYEGE
ncbi:hypothetical protein Tco_0898763 [Tanacetum coccineum]